jgi:hypothetical protein
MPSKLATTYQAVVDAENDRLQALSNEELLQLPDYQSQTVTMGGRKIFVATHHDTSHEGFHAFVVQAEHPIFLFLSTTYIAGFTLDSNQARELLPQSVVYEYS